MSDKKAINNHWNFWKGIVLKKDGSVNITQLKKELSDFSFILEQVPEVYCHITNNTLSKANYYAKDVTSLADECYRKMYLELFKEFLEEMNNQGLISKNAKDNLLTEIEHFI